MRPIDFPERNVLYAENQEEYLTLPAHRVNEQEGRVISCWKLSFRERLKLLFTGKLWACLMSFNKPLTPTFFTVHKTDLFPDPEPREPELKTNI